MKLKQSPSLQAVRKKMGSLAERESELVRDLILERGGSASNVNEAGPWAERSLLETALAATGGNGQAEKAIKIVKQAKQKGERY